MRRGLRIFASPAFKRTSERALDERQSAERFRVWARAHRATTLLLAATAVGLLVTLAALAAGAAGAAGGKALTAYAAPLVVTVLAAHWLMPLWVAAPTAQDGPADSGDRTA